MKNRKGQVAWVLIAVLAVAVIGIGAWAVTTQGSGTGSKTAVEDLNNCQTQPSLSLNVVEKHRLGTSVAESLQARVNGIYKGAVTTATTYSLNDEVELYANASGFVDDVLGTQTISACGTNEWKGKNYLAPTQDASITLYNSDDNPLTDLITGSTINQSAFNTTKQIKLRVNPANYEDTGILIVVVDTNQTSKVGTVKGSGLTSAPLPKSISGLFTTSQLDVFYLPNLENGATADYFISISPESGQDVEGIGVNVTVIGLQGYVDDDGSFVVPSVNKDKDYTADTDGTNVYEWIESKAFYIAEN